ncbi:MAG: hypothetical protein R2688_06685 [Fimbriimonadaceae bacterium]
MMGIGKAAVYKHIPDYFPNDIGVVGGLVGGSWRAWWLRLPDPLRLLSQGDGIMDILLAIPGAPSRLPAWFGCTLLSSKWLRINRLNLEKSEFYDRHHRLYWRIEKN